MQQCAQHSSSKGALSGQLLQAKLCTALYL